MASVFLQNYRMFFGSMLNYSAAVMILYIKLKVNSNLHRLLIIMEILQLLPFNYTNCRTKLNVPWAAFIVWLG